MLKGGMRFAFPPYSYLQRISPTSRPLKGGMRFAFPPYKVNYSEQTTHREQ